MSALRGEAQVEAGDLILSLVMNNSAWVAAEELLDKPWLDIVAYLIECEHVTDPETGTVLHHGRTVRLGTSRALLWAATRVHHPGLTIDACGDLVQAHSDKILPALGKAIRGSLPIRDDAPGEARPAATPATEANGTGGKHSTGSSKPAAPRATSGKSKPPRRR